jgi:hypothetical protein
MLNRQTWFNAVTMMPGLVMLIRDNRLVAVAALSYNIVAATQARGSCITTLNLTRFLRLSIDARLITLAKCVESRIPQVAPERGWIVSRGH